MGSMLQEMPVKWLWRSVLCLSLMACFAEPPGERALPQVHVGFAESIAPYVIPREERGIEVDIVREALLRAGFKLKPKYLPVQRLLAEYMAGVLDATANGDNSTDTIAAYSAPYIEFHNVIVTDAAKGIALDDVRQLAGMRVATFRRATISLGPAFKEAVSHSKSYVELDNDLDFCRMLRGGMVDAVASDEYIYRYHDAHLPVDGAIKLAIHHVLPIKRYEVAFHDARIRDAFDKALAQMRADGSYDGIVRRYVSDLP